MANGTSLRASSRNGAAKVRRDVDAPKPGDPVEAVLERIRTARNFDFRSYKRATLRRRIEHRALERKCRSVAQYLELLEREPSEFDALIASMLIKVTGFFRDAEVWDQLAKKVIPRLLADKRPGEELRIWCAGCATGEEAFSVAILLAEAMGPAFSTSDIKVFGTDVDERAIAHARRGLYRKAQVESLSPAMLREWFVEEADGFCVRKDVRRCVVFGVNNLVSDAPISRLDLLLCRNVFIYLDAAMQKRVLTRFHYALRRHGILVLGKSELIPFAARIYEPVDVARRVYRKDGKSNGTDQQERLIGLLQQESAARQEPHADLPAPEQFHRDILMSLRVPLIATAPDGTIMQWNQAATELWGRGEGEATGKKLAALNLPGLSGEFLIEKTAAVREGKSERETGAGVVARASDGQGLQISVEVVPLRNGVPGLNGLLYAVYDVSHFHELEADLRKANEEKQSAHEELQTINEEMQSSNEELETTNEELQSANEELQTTNEELQSTNEELETTNEELQSTNVELDAINRELAHRTDEMNRLSLYQRTIIRSLSAAVIVLERQGRITIWNLAAERLLGLTEGETLGQVLWTLHLPAVPRSLQVRLRKALANGMALRNETVEYELPTGGVGHALVSAVPLADNGEPLGAVIIFEDMTRAAAVAWRKEEKSRRKE